MATELTLNKLKELLGVDLVQHEVDFDTEGYSSVESYSAVVPYSETDHDENVFYINVYDGNSFCFFYDASPIALSIHTEDEARHMIQTLVEVPLPIDKLNKEVLQEVYDYINTANGYECVKPNVKLYEATGYPYATFYISTQVAEFLINFEDPGHLKLLRLLIEQSHKLNIPFSERELSKSDTQRGRRLFKKVLNEDVSYCKHSGADCTIRLSSVPSDDINEGKRSWLYLSMAEFEKFI